MIFKSGRGGYRPGGGRPKGSTMPVHLKRVKLTPFRLPQWIIDWIQQQPKSGGRVIEEAMIHHYNLKEPKERG